MRIPVSLDKPDVRLNHRSLVPNPESLRVLESLQRPFFERLGIGKLHVPLIFILGILGSFLMIASNETHDGRVIAVDQSQCMSLQRTFVDRELSFLSNISTCSRDTCDSRSNQHIKATISVLPQSGVFLFDIWSILRFRMSQNCWDNETYHKEAFLLQEIRHSTNLCLGDSRGVWVVR